MPDKMDLPRRELADGKALLEYEQPASGDLIIVNFSVDERERGKGYGRRALQELRAEFPKIVVCDIGDETNSSRGFWIKMRAEGWVDELIDVKW